MCSVWSKCGRWLPWAWILVFLVLVGMGQAALAVSESLGRGVIPAEVQVRGPELRLGEIATFSGVEPTLRAQLEAISLGSAPRPGESVTLPRGTVLTRLRSSLPQLKALQWQISDRVTIRRRSQTVDMARVSTAIQTFVEGHLAVVVEQVTVDQVQLSQPLRLAEGEVGLEVEAASGDDLIGPVNLTLVARVDGGSAVRVPVRARVVARARVMVATRSLRRGETITADHVRSELLTVTGGSSVPASQPGDVVGRQCRRAIGPGQMLSMDDAEEKALIRRGDSVLLVVHTAHLTLGCPGEAIQDGRVGDMITVLNPMSQRQVRGRVRESGEVVVEYRTPTRLTSVSGTAR